MEKLIKFAIVFLLSNAIQYCSCERFNIIPTPGSPCPELFTGEPCLTLQQYVTNPSLSSNITLELHSGNHRLDAQLSAANINSFTMRANATVSIQCSQQLQSYSYDWFRFDQVQEVHVSGITFIGCKLSLNSITNVTFVRDTFVNKSLINCCYGGPVLYIRYSTSVLIRQCTINNNRGYRAINGHGINTFILDKSRLENNFHIRDGGAIYLTYVSGNISIFNSNFSGNGAFYNSRDGGGAVYVSTSQKVTICNCLFNNNTAGGSGGAVYVSGKQVNITNSNFTDNRASNTQYGVSGGAVYISSQLDVNLRNIHCTNSSLNVAAYTGATEALGGAICVNVSMGGVNMTDVYFSNNTIVSRVNRSGGALYISCQHDVHFQNIHCTNNSLRVMSGGGYYRLITATLGGAIYVNVSTGGVSLTDVYFSDNMAGPGSSHTSSGGAVYISSALDVTFKNTYYANNSAKTNYGTCTGGAVHCESSTGGINMTNVTISNSTAASTRYSHGGAIYITSALDVNFKDVHCINSTAKTSGSGYGIGGAIYCASSGGGVNMTDVLLTDNTAGQRLTGYYGGTGGAVYIHSVLDINFRNIRCINNTAGSHNGNGGAIYCFSSRGDVKLDHVILQDNTAGSISSRRANGGAVYIYRAQNLTLNNINGTNNRAGTSGGAIYCGSLRGDANMTDVTISNNTAGLSGDGSGGAVYINNDASLNIKNAYFNNNNAGINSGDGGAIYVNTANITFENIYFINNTAISGGGGATYSARRYTNTSYANNTFSYNTAAYCGVMDIDGFFHYHVNIAGNTFTYNRAVGLVVGNNGGGVICIRNASISLMDNNFSHNTATGDAGVIRVDESHVTIQRSIFSNNTAGGNGGVFHTYFYPTTYTISHSFFTDNQAGGDGGVTYVGRAGSYVTISHSTFISNRATNRGGVLAVIGTTVHINGATISDNMAQLGEVVSACNSNVTFSDPQISPTQDPVYSFCSLYDSSNGTVSRTRPQPPSITDTTTNPVIETATTTQQDSTTTTTQATTATNEQTITPTLITTGVTATTGEDITTSDKTNKVTATVATTTDGETPTIKDNDIAMTTSTEYTTTNTDTTAESSMSEGTMITSDIISTSSSKLTTEFSTKAASDKMVTMTTTSPQDGTTSEENFTTEKDSLTESFETDSIATTIKIVTKPTDGKEQDSTQLDIHQIRIPGYSALAVSAVLLILVIVFGAVIINKVYHIKQPQPKLTYFNLNEDENSTIEDEHTLSDVQVDSTTVTKALLK